MLERLIKQSESEVFEKKSSLSDINRIVEVISSFSNTKGGKILIGASDKGNIIGVEIGRNTIEKLADKIVDNTDPKIYPEISILEIENKNLVLISVDLTQQKPHLAFGRAFKRVGKNTKPLSRTEYEKMLLKKNKDKMKFDSFECKGARLTNIDEKKLKEFLLRAKSERRLKMNTDINSKEVLTKLKLLKNNKLTNAAILMFSKEPQDFLIQSEIRCAKFKGIFPAKPFIDMKVIKGTIDEQIDLVVRFIMNNIRKSAWLAPGQVKRSEKWEYPLNALREAVTNAICHRDYSSTANVQIRIFDDRIEVWNPGNLPDGWTVETLKKKHESKPKNPLIAKLFFMIRNIEQWGTGTNEMIKATVQHGLPELEFEDTGTSIVVTFRKPILFQGEDLNDLNERQKKAIEYVQRRGRISNEEYKKLNKVDKKTSTRDLTDIVEKGLLEKIGKTGRGTYYVSRGHKGDIKGT